MTTADLITIDAQRQSIVDLLEREARAAIGVEKLLCSLTTIAAQYYEIPREIALKAIVEYNTITEKTKDKKRASHA